MIKIAPSILAADFSRLGEEITRIEAAGADMIHLDIMDGHFVPNITIGPDVVRALRKYTKLPFDVHLMISNPDAYITAFAQAGADNISVHAENNCHLHRTVHQIKEIGIKASVVLNPATPIQVLEHILPDLDMVLLMTVNPGFGGQKYISAVDAKISELRRRINEEGLNTDIEVDGGVTTDNIARIVKAGANVFVAGSSVFGAPDPREAISLMKERAAAVR